MAGALIGALRVSLSAETSAFEAGMKRSQRTAATTANSIKGSFSSLGRTIERSATGFITALTLGSIVAAGKAALDYAGHLGELADTLGLTTKDLQTFGYAAGQVGVSQEQLQQGIQKLTISMGQAQLGAKKQADAFNAIGISIADLKGKDAGDTFRLIAEKLENVSDRSKRAAVEVALFGKAGAKLDNLLSGSQGRLSELSDAAEKLGIVLSDEQIQNADKTADKIEALTTALKARIAGVVADNANSIYSLIDALSALVSKLPVAIRSYQAFLAALAQGRGYLAQISRNPADRSEGRLQVAVAESQLRDLQNQQAGGDSFATRAARLRNNLGLGPAPSSGSGGIGNFLAHSGGGGGRAKHGPSAEELERKRVEALRKALDLAEEQRKADEDILSAKKDLSQDYVEQTSLQIAIMDSERAGYKAQLDFEVASKEKTQAQADGLLAQYDIADSLKRQAVLHDEEEHRLRDVAMLEDHDIDRRQELLSKLDALATTQSERRKIELDILDLAYQEKKQALERIINNSKDEAAIEDARRDLLALKAIYTADRQGVINQTRNPFEEWAASIPKTKAEILEAMQEIEVQGIDGVAEALTGVLTGTESLKSAFHNLAASILADLIQMTIKMLLFRALMAAFGGGGGIPAPNLGGMATVDISSVPVRAAGGPVLAGRPYLVGERGPELFMPKLPGSIVPNNMMTSNNIGGGRPMVHITNNIDATGADPAALARVRVELQQMQASIPTQVVATMNDARERFLWRGK